MRSTKKSDTQPRGKSIACSGKLPKLHSSTSKNPAQVMCFIQFHSFFLQVSALTFQLPVVRSTEEAPEAICCLHSLCSGSSSVILIKELSVKELTPVAYKTWEEEKAKLAPEPAGTMIMKEVCALHTTATFQCITQQQLLPHPSYQCLTAPVTSIKRNKSRIFLSETLQGDAGKNKYIFNLPSQEIVYH